MPSVVSASGNEITFEYRGVKYKVKVKIGEALSENEFSSCENKLMIEFEA